MASIRSNGGTIWDMDLEERTIESIGEHCEECGARLTPAELAQAMERGGPALCTVHAVENEPLDPDALEEPADG